MPLAKKVVFVKDQHFVLIRFVPYTRCKDGVRTRLAHWESLCAESPMFPCDRTR